MKKLLSHPVEIGIMLQLGESTCFCLSKVNEQILCKKPCTFSRSNCLFYTVHICLFYIDHQVLLPLWFLKCKPSTRNSVSWKKVGSRFKQYIYLQGASMHCHKQPI